MPSLKIAEPSVNDATLFDWRKYLPVHPAADAFPTIPHDGLIAIGEDIKANGLRFPIIVQREFGCRVDHASFSVLDGRSRLDAMVAVGIEFEIAHLRRYEGPTIETQGGPTVDIQVVELPPHQIAAFVLSVNLHRRHLDAEGKRAAIDALLKLNPGKSDRQIAKQTGSSPTTVGKQRKKAESAGDVSILDTRTDAAGRRQPAKKVSKKIAKPAANPAMPDKAAPAAAVPPVNAKDTALVEFDGHICRLLQMTGKAKPTRFAKTGVSIADLVLLSQFLAKLAGAMKDTTPPAPQAVEEKTPTEEAPPAVAPSDIVIPSGSKIYVPAGQALEYAELAANPYRGCGHECRYCYVPGIEHMPRQEFDAGAVPRNDYLIKLKHDARRLQARGITGQVMLSFLTDVYNPVDTSLTRPTIEILIEHGFGFCVLTKGGSRALVDIDLYRPEHDAFAATLTSLDDRFSQKWERRAALPGDRIEALRTYHARGVFTWVSLEPTLDVEASLGIVEATYSFVDLYKVGKANYLKAIDRVTDWAAYTSRMVEVLNRVGARHYIKRDLQPYLPPDYPNPLRVPQHHERH